MLISDSDVDVYLLTLVVGEASRVFQDDEISCRIPSNHAMDGVDEFHNDLFNIYSFEARIRPQTCTSTYILGQLISGHSASVNLGHIWPSRKGRIERSKMLKEKLSSYVDRIRHGSVLNFLMNEGKGVWIGIL